MKSKLVDLMCGPVVVVFTPFDEKGEHVLEETLRNNVKFMVSEGISNGCGALIAGGSVGDSFVLSDKERKRVFKIVVEAAGGRVPVICGVNSTSTGMSLKLGNYAQKIGADGIMVTPPFYYKTITDEATYKHYKCLSDELNIGIMIYNNTAVLNKDLSIELLSRLSELKNIIAIKESTPDRRKYKKVVDELGDKIAVINGAGEDTEPSSYQMGTQGFITGYGNFVPDLCVQIHKEAIKGNYEQVERVIERFNPIKDVIYNYVNEVGPEQIGRIYKEIAINLGFKLGGTRLPIIPVELKYRRKLKNAIKKSGFLAHLNNKEKFNLLIDH